MTVDELIARLQELPEEDRDKPVWVDYPTEDYGGSTVTADVVKVFSYPKYVRLDIDDT